MDSVAHLLTEDVGEDATDDQDDEEEECEDKISEEQAFDFFIGRETSEEGEKDDKARRDDDDIDSIHIQAISQQLIKERFVIHGPNTKN